MNKLQILYDAAKYTKIIYREKYGTVYAYVNCPFCYSTFEGATVKAESFILNDTLTSLEAHLDECPKLSKDSFY